MALPAPLQNIKTLAERLTWQQKIAMVGAGGLVMAVIWVAVYLSQRVDYQVVFSDLQPSEAQGIIQKLQELKVQYQLSTDGRTISVESEKASEARIQLASQGLPSSGRIGFEIFDQTNFGLTNFQEQVNYQRALEGELARSIMTLSEVEAARVHLVLPKDSLFQSAEDQTKASVILKLKAGRNLSDGAISGIVNVVASSVKGLTPERVTLIDYRGKVLARPESGGSLTGQQLDERLKLENELSSKIIQILEPAVGQGKVRPQVSVNMAFAQVEETTEKFDPQGAVVRSQQKQEERQPQPRPVGGIPGPKAAGTPNQLPQNAILPPVPTPGTSAAAAAANLAVTPPADNVATKQSETVNYEISKSVRHTVEPVGTVKSVSVAVIIDNHTKVTNGQNGKPQTTTEPRSAEDMKKYRDIVSAAVGFNPDRGDKLTVENVSFEDESELVKEPTFVEKQGPLLLTGLRYLIIPIAFVLIYLLFLRPVKKVVFATLATAGVGAAQLPAGQMMKALPQALGARPQVPLTVKQLEAQISGAAPEAAAPAPSPTIELESLNARTKMEEIRDRVVERAKQDPENVARLVRVWLNDDRTK